MSTPDAVTITAAAEGLGVSKPRIHQLLRDEALTGPAVGPGRAAPDAPRVWRSSLDAEVRRRQDVADRDSAPKRHDVSKRRARDGNRNRSQRNAPQSDAPEAEASAAQAQAARAAAQRMKVALDLAREALRAERAQTRKITRALADTVALLENQQRLADQADTVADGYGDALTQLLSPTDTSSA